MKEALYLPAAVILRRPFLLVPHLFTFAEVRDGVAGHTDLARSAEMNRLRVSVAAAFQNLRAHALKGRGSARQRRKTSRVSSGRKREFTARKHRPFLLLFLFTTPRSQAGVLRLESGNLRADIDRPSPRMRRANPRFSRSSVLLGITAPQ